MALEYGINFNTEAGRQKAEEEIKKWSKDMQKYFDNNPFNIDIGGKKVNAVKVATTHLQGYRKELQDLRNEYKKLTTAELANGGAAPIIEKYRALKEQVGIYGGTLDQAVKAEDKLAAQAERHIPTINRQTAAYKKQSDVLIQLKSYAMNFLSVYAGIRMVKNLARVSGEFETQKVSLQAILQDAEKGEAIFERIKELAVVSPFQFKDLVSYTKQLSAFSVPYEELYDTTKMLADLSAGLGVGMDRIILAYGQVRSAAVLRGQELRQFTEAGIPLVEELRKKLSEANNTLVTTGEVFEYISARKVPFEMVRDVLVEMTSEGGKFYKMQEVQADTLKGKIANLTDAFEIMLANIGESDGGIMKGTVDTVRSLIENYEKVGAILTTLAVTYGTYRAAVMAANVAELAMNGTYITKIRMLRAIVVVQRALNAAINTNPYVLLATAVVGLATAYFTLRDNVSAAEKGIQNFNNRMEQQQQYVESERNSVNELINTIKDETKTRRERQLKINELQGKYPSIFKNLDIETAKNIDLAGAIRSVNEELDRRSSKSNDDRVIEISKLLVRLRAEHGKYIFAGTESYQVNNLEKIRMLEAERTELIKKSRAEREAELASTRELADWQKSVNNFVSKNNAGFLSFSDEDGTASKYINRVRQEYSDLRDEYATYSTLVDDGSKKHAERLKEQMRLTEQLANSMGFALEKSTPTTSVSKSNSQVNALNAMVRATERLAELRANMANAEERYNLERKQADIDRMKDGTEKQLAQIDLAHEKEIQRIKEREEAFKKSNLDIARAEWESKGKKGVFSEEVELTKSQISLLESMRATADMNHERSKEKLLESLLNKYKDYAQKIKDIEEQKNKDITDLNAGRDGSNDDIIDRAIVEVQKKAKEEAASLAFDEMKNSEAWRVLFSDLEDYTVKTLKKTLEEVQKADTSNLNASDARAIYRGIDKLKKKIAEDDPIFALTKGWKDFIQATKDNQPDAALEAINMMISGAEELLSYYKEFQSLAGSAFGEDSNVSFWTNTVGDILGANISTGGGIAKILVGDYTGIKDVISGVTSYINIFRKIRNRKHDKEIKKQERAVSDLEKEYRKLERAMRDSLGSDYYENATKQADNLKAQAEALNKQIEAEKKKGKDKDEDKINDLERQRDELIDSSVDVVKDAVEKLTGTNLVQTAEDFASAWMDAYVSFGNTTEAMRDRFKEMMKDMVINSMISKIMKKWMEPVFKMIDDAWSDSKYTPEEMAQVWSQGLSAIVGANEETENLMGMLENLGVDLRDEQETNLTGISKSIASITEDTALILGAYLDSIRMKLFQYIDYMMLPENKPTMAVLYESQTAMITHLRAIEINTRLTAESNSEILNKVNDIIISSGTGKGWAVNINME